MPRLTIGIPTYNFGAMLEETLASVTDALPEGVEILVVDGGSTDDTPEIMRTWMSREPMIRYHRKDQRDGIDVDMALTVALARADYCWLLSADDLVAPGAVAAVLTHVAQKPDVVLLAHSNCDAQMREIQPKHPVLAGGTRLWAVRDAAARQRYFTAARTTEALFSFVSGLVVRRSAWDVERATGDLFYGSCWAHAARLLLAMRTHGLDILYVDTPLVARRGENDSFAGRGIVARYRLAIDGYAAIVGDVFGWNGVEHAETLRLLRNEFTTFMFMNAKRATDRRPEIESRAELARLFDYLYPRALRHAPQRLLFRLPTVAFLAAFTAANAVRHRLIGRTQ